MTPPFEKLGAPISFENESCAFSIHEEGLDLPPSPFWFFEVVFVNDLRMQ